MADNSTLFFIPDISGFTKFINETEIEHSQHIIKDLLELLVDADVLGLTVSEFEGDAILFFKKGEPPSLNKFLEQAEKMFVGFHTHLKKYETHRLCQCGACRKANELTLKIIAHYGESTGYKVKDSEKLHGKDVILAHRLLKNSIDHNEYFLISEKLQNAFDREAYASDWYSEKSGSDSYDEIGEVKYLYSYLSPLLEKVKAEPPLDCRIDRPLKMFEVSRIINLPAEEVFGIVIDLPKRIHWIANAKDVKVFSKGLNQEGTRHVCVIENSPDSEFITANLQVDEDHMEFWEIDRKKIKGAKYVFEKISGTQSKVTAEIYINDNFMLKTIYKLMFEKKLKMFFNTSLDNLKRYCEESKGS